MMLQRCNDFTVANTVPVFDDVAMSFNINDLACYQQYIHSLSYPQTAQQWCNDALYKGMVALCWCNGAYVGGIVLFM
jgi:hypothetical protein